MAELLVRVVDKVNTSDFYLNTKCTKRGDVISVCPDGHPWGTAEVSNPEWRIVLVPGVDPGDLSGLIAAERDTDPQQPSKTLQRRAFKLDLDHEEIDKAGLRDFCDVHTGKPVAADSGKTLEEIAVVQDGKTRYLVDKLSVDLKSTLSTLAVTAIGPEGVREHCVAEMPDTLVTTITTAKAQIADPNIIGGSSGVIG